ncbi:hypothetical protein F7725_006309 [Dissostichus mawsoni]|uniref:Uncharacterized protein n=1 Tax=Dissostichus mawsoni TaxID=36200 RepID=A0A7J5XV96_DISMA|nr:hypothetical protein F7725_006309 [Dissostichus mawsoni]
MYSLTGSPAATIYSISYTVCTLEELLEGFSREQLICVAEHFHLDVGDKRMKENIRGIVKANLFELGAFKGGKYTVDPSRDSVNMSGCRDA